MVKSLPLFIGLRYFFASSGNRLVSFISGLAVTGLVLGVALLIVVLSVMNGFERELRDKILNLVSHVQLHKHGGIADWRALANEVEQRPQIISATPYTEVPGMLTRRGVVQPVALRGEILGAGNSAFQQYLDIPAAEGIEKPLFISGKTAAKLGLAAGDKVRMVIPSTTGYNGSGPSSRTVAFTVAGTFNTNTELDQALVVTRLSVASELAGLAGRVQALQLQVVDIFSSRWLATQLLNDIPGTYAYDWTGRYGNLYYAIRGSKNLVLLLIFLIVAIAAFNVISMLVMTVTDKRPAIAILKTLGCSERDILAIFFTKGSLIGLMGCTIGAGLGVVLSTYIGSMAKWLEQQLGVQFLNTEVYPVDILPSHLLWSDVVVVVAVAFTLNMLATLYPAWKAGRVRPADELRYE